MSTPGDPLAISRLPFLDGIRGFAALTVVLGHSVRSEGKLATGENFFHATWGDRLVWLAFPGSEMVFLFLVVSGFALYYSEDVNRSRRGPTPMRVFAKRRAWRILPLYYVALAWGLLVVALLPSALVAGSSILTPAPITWGGLLSHLTLTHNFSDQWIHQVNAPLWSMAYEAQLYLLFPLLYFATKRFNPVAVAIAAILLDVIFHHYLPEIALLGLLRWFALGILVAATYREKWVQLVPRWILTGLAVVTLSIAYLRVTTLWHGLLNDAVWGTAFVLMILAMTRAPASRWNPANAKWMRWLGDRSYSLYALHFPVLLMVFAGAGILGMEGRTRFVVVTVVGVGASILVAMMAHRFVEKPSMARARIAGRPRIAPLTTTSIEKINAVGQAAS